MLAACTALLIATNLPSAHAQKWTIDPSVAVESTVTDNVDLVSSDRRRSDWVNQFTPAVSFTERGAHTQFQGSISVPILVYLRTGSENNYVAPAVNIAGTVEAIDRWLYIDAAADVSQQFLSPFGAQPTNLSSATQNRYTAQSYRISPYIKRSLADGIDYEVRQSSLWTDANATGIQNSGRAFTNEVSGHVGREARPVGWRAEYNWTDSDFQDSRGSETLQIGRVRGLHRPDPAVEVSASVGYEDNDFFFTQERGVTYGAGIRWHPNERTGVDAMWEHRFFGASYHVTADHRTPLSVWSISASRDLSTYPQQIASLPQGSNVSALLNSLFSSQFPDPTQRQSFVDQIIRERGLPATLNSPVSLFSRQTTLVESFNATAGLIGARNSIFFTAYRLRNQPVQSPENANLSQLLTDLLDNTQLGTNVVWSHQLTPIARFSAAADWSRTTANSEPNQVTRQYSLRAVVSTALSTLTNVYAGVRYQDSNTDVFDSYRELAAFVGLTHTFH